MSGYPSALSDPGDAQGFVKAGFFGFAKSGKSYTAAMFAVAIRRHFGLKGPIAMFDTETGSVYLKKPIFDLTGQELLAKRARSLDALLAWGKACVENKVSVGLVDSITHPWRELCDSYLNQVNEFRRKKGWSSQKKLEFQDWGPIKARFAEWSDFYLNSPMHLVIAGRAGDMFEHQEREDDPGKKDLVKTGVKMLTEKEFGFEPSLLVMMEGEQLEIRGKRIITRRATVLGDRFTVLDGHQVDFGSFDKKGVNVGHEAACKAVGDFFQAHLDCYMANAHVPVDTETKTDFAMDESGDDNWTAEKRRRTIYLEEIQGEITRRYPGQTAAEKKKKLELLELIFATRSWTKIEGMASNDLRECLRELRAHLQPKGLPPAADEDAPDPDMPDPDTLLASNPADG